MGANVRFQSHVDVVLERVHANVDAAVKNVGDMLVEGIQEKMLYGYSDPHGSDGHTEIVETGNLFDSIESAVDKVSQNTFEVHVGTNVSYAKYVHDGTYKLKSRPFIRDGVMGNMDQVEQILQSDIKEGL